MADPLPSLDKRRATVPSMGQPKEAEAASMHHGGSFGRYMELKVTKLAEQFEAQALQLAGQGSRQVTLLLLLRGLPAAGPAPIRRTLLTDMPPACLHPRVACPGPFPPPTAACSRACPSMSTAGPTPARRSSSS